MAVISLGLPDEIESRLMEEVRLDGCTRSEVALAAIVEYLDRREKERFMAESVEEMRRAYADPEIRREALKSPTTQRTPGSMPSSRMNALPVSTLAKRGGADEARRNWGR